MPVTGKISFVSHILKYAVYDKTNICITKFLSQRSSYTKQKFHLRGGGQWPLTGGVPPFPSLAPALYICKFKFTILLDRNNDWFIVLLRYPRFFSKSICHNNLGFSTIIKGKFLKLFQKLVRTVICKISMYLIAFLGIDYHGKDGDLGGFVA